MNCPTTELFDSKTFHRFIFNDVFEQYKKLFTKTQNAYINYYEMYEDFVKSNFYYLNYVYTKLWCCNLQKKEKSSHLANNEIKALYSLCYPSQKKSSILNRFEEDFQIIQNLYLNRCLYHYTNSEALLSIFETHTLRFSNLSRSNDNSEGEYLDKYFSIYHKKDMDNFAEHKETVNVFSFSLSFKADDVAQWKRYGEKEDKNDGVCLVFDCMKLFSFLKFLYPALGFFFISPLKYASFDNIIKKDLIAELAWENLSKYNISMLNNLRYMFKDKSFDSEKEFRLFFCFEKKLAQFTKLYGFLNKNLGEDFLSMSIDKDIFSQIVPKIIFGPNLSDEKKEKIIKSLHDNYGNKVICLESGCPVK